MFDSGVVPEFKVGDEVQILNTDNPRLDSLHGLHGRISGDMDGDGQGFVVQITDETSKYCGNKYAVQGKHLKLDEVDPQELAEVIKRTVELERSLHGLVESHAERESRTRRT